MGRVAAYSGPTRKGQPYRCLGVLGCCLSLTALGALAPWAAWGSPLPKSSPLYSPGPSIVDENPDVRAEYKGTITTMLNAPPVPESVEQHTRTATMNWAESVSGPVDEIEYTGVYGNRSIHWKLEKLAGQVVKREPGRAGKPSGARGPSPPFVPMSAKRASSFPDGPLAAAPPGASISYVLPGGCPRACC